MARQSVTRTKTGKQGRTAAESVREQQPGQPGYDLFSFSTGEDGALQVKQYGGDALGRIFGSESPAVNQGLMLQSFRTLKANEVEAGTYDMRGFMPAIVRDIAPQDGVERMLAVQMASTHAALIRVGGKMANAENLNQFEAYERAYTKLVRTYTAQMEALRKHRNGGSQTVTVQHVNVGDGGQAIVGTVETGGRGAHER